MLKGERSDDGDLVQGDVGVRRIQGGWKTRGVNQPPVLDPELHDLGEVRTVRLVNRAYVPADGFDPTGLNLRDIIQRTPYRDLDGLERVLKARLGWLKEYGDEMDLG